MGEGPPSRRGGGQRGSRAGGIGEAQRGSGGDLQSRGSAGSDGHRGLESSDHKALSHQQLADAGVTLRAAQSSQSLSG